MKHLALFMFVALVAVSCSNSDNFDPNSPGGREMVPNPEKYEHDGYSTISDSLKPVFSPDTSAGRLSLVFSKTVSGYLGENIVHKMDTGSGMPYAAISSKDGKQQLMAFFHPGGSEEEFFEFVVAANDRQARERMIVVKDDRFITESGIELGITIGTLRSIKGEPVAIAPGWDATVYHYEIKDQSSEFLKRYNMPSYYADYTFKNGYLIGFKFGFEYP